ncbi:HIT family protein [Nocardia sp. NPDC049149]|uniref:HIT family protein n=1 Tax=Nocardia sp. NPDC049149 TaxID=3364315 RepID=UPI003721C033
MSLELGQVCNYVSGAISRKLDAYARGLAQPMHDMISHTRNVGPHLTDRDQQFALPMREPLTGGAAGAWTPFSRIAERTWIWGPEDVVKRWPGALAVRPKNGVAEGHLIVVSDGPRGASVAQRVAYAAELAKDMESCNVIVTRRGLGADFGPVSVVPRKFGDKQILAWTKQHEGQPFKPLKIFPCGFCKVIAGSPLTTLLRKWSDGIALEPLDPVRPGGHRLVIPNGYVPGADGEDIHVQDVSVDPATSGAMMAHVVELTRDTPNVDIITSRGEPATQTAGHLHIHAVTRDENDGLEMMLDRAPLHVLEWLMDHLALR